MMKILLTALLIFTFYGVKGQSEEEWSLGVNEYSLQPLDEALMEDESSTTFILDNTKTKIGRDLYEEFYRQWNGIQLDSTALVQFKASTIANQELIIDLEEIPSPGLSNIVSIKVGDLLVWQQFVQARADALETQVAEAVQEVLQYFIGYQEVQNQLGTEDQSGTGIF